MAMLALEQARYTGRTVKHFRERWDTEHGGTRSDRWTKKTRQGAGHVTRAPRRVAHCKKRPRNPVPGMMLHQDGSTHEWVPDCQWNLSVTLDDATTEIYSAFFVEKEGTLSSLRGLQKVIGTKGLFSSLYTDRGSHDWHTDEAGGTVDKSRSRQVHRALQQLGVTLIPAYSPEALGRSNRAFRTLQDRLPKELALAGITEMAAANWYLTEQFLPTHNTRFTVQATEAGTAFTPWIGTHLAEIICVQDERVVAKDRTVRYQGLSLQIPQDPHRFHDVKVTVRVHAYPEGILALFQSWILGQRWAKRFWRAAERLEGKKRADHALYTPDKVTCHLQLASAPPTIREALHAKDLGGTALGDPIHCHVVFFTVLEREASTPGVG